MATQTARRRVKLYVLNEQRDWADRGTGHVSSVYIERLKGMALLVRSEDDGSILLESKIQPHTAYQRQQGTLIIWSEAENYNLALSFQEESGCDEIWEKICQVQGKDPTVEITQEIVEESEDEKLEDLNDTTPPIELPPCELSRLEEISEMFNSVLPNPVRREKLTVAIENTGYIKQLLELFHMCEDLENLDGLHHLYEIFKSIFLLNKNSLFDIMFTDDLIFDVVGVLEYDPTVTTFAKHREYLRTKANFKEVVPLNNPELVQKIHQTYRVQYIQDVILPTPSVFEENTLSTLSSFIFFNKIEIVGMIQEDAEFLSTLFSQLVEDETDDDRRRDLILFLKELCTFSQALQPQQRENFFKTLSNWGILNALEMVLGLDDEAIKTAAIDVFSYIVEFSPSMVREFILQEGQKQDDDDLLINMVIDQMINDSDPELGGAVQLMGIIRLLIDPENMLAMNNKTEKSEFLSFFYKHSMHVLTAPLFANTGDDKPSKDDYHTCQLLALILELLTFCIEHHTYHIKNYMLNKDLLRRVLVLLKSRHAFVALGALRFMRRVIGLKDEFFNRYIVKGNLFKPVVDAFCNNGTRYNLFNSAMIEMFEFIRTEDIKLLVIHIVDHFNSQLENVDYVQTFKNLKLRSEQHAEKNVRDKPVLDSMPSILRSARYRRDARAMEEEEEMWFEQDDDLDDGETIIPMSDTLRRQLDSEFDSQINRLFDSKKLTGKDPDFRDSPPKLGGRTATINININRSPPGVSPTPHSSPVSSPITSPVKPNAIQADGQVQVKKPLVGLVDYPDEDSEEEEEEENMPVSKRPRLST